MDRSVPVEGISAVLGPGAPLVDLEVKEFFGELKLIEELP